MRTLVFGIALITSAPTLPAPNVTEALYRQHCAACHGTERLGITGPALLPVSLKRLKTQDAIAVISDGRAATQMPGFADRLSRQAIEGLVDYIYQPPAKSPQWSAEAIRASHIVHRLPPDLPDRPAFDADPLDLFVVVETGDHHASVLDGDRFERIHRFPTRFALHGGPKFSPDGRFVYFASRDGWVSKYDLYNLAYVAEIRVGINTRNIAVSKDGRFVMAANLLPGSLVALNADDLSLIKVIPAIGADGNPSRLSAVYTAPPRGSFIAAMKDIPEVWEIPYSPRAQALPVYRGLMHDWRGESGEAPTVAEGPFPVRRIVLDEPVDDFFFDPDYQHLIGAARDGRGKVVNLTVGRVVADLPFTGMPHLGSGISWERNGRRVMATPNLREGAVTVVDMQSWEPIATIETLGPGFFLRSHENSPYAWVDVFFGPNREAVHVIDKRTLKIVKTLRPAPGKTAAHVEFDREGEHAVLSIWDREGAVIVYDAKTLKEQKRLPMDKPSGKYNVWNKTRYSEGTSH